MQRADHVPTFAPWLAVYPYLSFLPFNASGKASAVRVQKTIQTDTVPPSAIWTEATKWQWKVSAT